MHFPKHPVFILLLCLMALPSSAAINEHDYDQVFDLIQQVYQPIFSTQGQRLQITKYWKSDSLSATAWKHEDSEGEISVIQINGGIARHPNITKDGFALMVCQTIGHHLAGPPLIWKFSVEGQADYFGASSCLRKILPLMGDSTGTRLAPEEELTRLCSQTSNDKSLCTRIINAGRSLANFYAAKESKAPPALNTPDTSSADGILHDAISPQCRLDTYVAAAMCEHSPTNGTPESPPWLCESSKRTRRPACWYNPK